MATERNTSSVLAKLMGIDKVLPSSKINGRRRVFSENYRRNVSSMMDMDKSILDTSTDVFSMGVSDYEDCEETAEFSEGASVDYPNFGLVSHSGDSQMKSKWNEVLSSSKTSFDQRDGLGQRGRTRPYTSLGYLALSQQQRSCQIGDSRIFSVSTNKKQKTVPCVRDNGLGIQERRIGHNSMKSKVREKVSPREIAKQITNEVNRSVWHTCVKGSRCKGKDDKSDVDEYVGNNSHNTKKTCLKSRKERKYDQEVRTCHGIKTVDQMHGLDTHRSKSALNCEDVNYRSFIGASARFLSNPTFFPSAWVPRSKERRFTLDRNWCSSPTNFSSAESSAYPETGEILNVKWNNHVGNNSSKELSVVAAHSTYDSALTSWKTAKTYMYSKIQRDILPLKSCKSISFDDASPSSQKDFVQKHELRRTNSPPGSPVSSLEGPEACRRCLDFTVKSKEISLPSCLDDDVLGLQTTLHWIEAVSTDSGSEGPGMVVSSDASDGGGSTGCYREDTQIAERTSESCDFSYLVDVLVESGMMTGNLEMESGRWCTSKYVLDPSVFDFLEKKFGKSTVTEKSERKLFFDRINSGLNKILRPSVGLHSWKKPVVERLSVRRCHDFIEEELWALLVNQEEVNRDLSGFVYEVEPEWLDLEDEVKFVVEEIQCLLLDEFVEEFLILEMLCR